MPVADLLNMNNKKVGTLELDESIFGVVPNESLLHEVVVMQLANRRLGTAATKTKGMVSGGGRKPWKQKKTGRARHGSIRSPLWRHGGITFGPLPRDYSYSMPKKKIRAAICSALSAKVRDKELIVLDNLELKDHKTKNVVDLLKKLNGDQKVLIVIDELDKNLLLAARNIPGLRMLDINKLNVYDILNHKHVIITKRGIEKIRELWAS